MDGLQKIQICQQGQADAFSILAQDQNAKQNISNICNKMKKPHNIWVWNKVQLKII